MSEVGPADAADPVKDGGSVALPSELLRQISADGGSRVVLVVGAGASMQAPTNLKSGAIYSFEAHRKLVADGVLADDECSDPYDLSALADVVYNKASGSQKELTSRLPKDDWRSARPNRGHLLAAALLTEGALRHVVTLNYDLAFQNAFSVLGNTAAVSFIHGPDDHARIGAHSVVYLHRSVDQDEETWVLRKSALDSDWVDGWEGAVAAANLSAPLTVFVGLGSPAQVLTDSVARLAEATQSSYYLVDPNTDSKFAAALGENVAETVQLLWSDFMSKLADRVVQEQAVRLHDAAETFLAEEPDLNPGNADVLIDAMCRMDLLEVGKARSRWMQAASEYLAEGDATRRRYAADLALGLGWVVRILDAENIEFDEGGRATIRERAAAEVHVGLVHAQGMKTWAAVSSKLKEANDSLPPSQRVRHVVVAGLRSMGSFTTDDLIRDDNSEDLIRGADTILPFGIDEARNTYATEPARLRERLTL